MNNAILKVFLFLSVLFFANNMKGQTTYYYKLTKKIVKGEQFTNTAGGQFITFSDDKCFDSDKYGKSVGNGQLVYRKDFSEDSKTYLGNSYFGNVLYRFKPDLSVLNIVVNSNLIYVYKRQTAPSSATTCSLIRKQNSSSNGMSVPMSAYSGVVPPVVQGSASTSSSHGSTTSSSSTTSSGKTCYLCHGIKKCWTCNGNRTYLVGSRYEKCPNCTDGWCRACHGAGKL